MFSMRVAVLLLAFVCCTIAFECYSGSTTSNENPGDKTDCTSQYCSKVIVSAEDTVTYNYGCDLTETCREDDCHDGVDGTQICCCGSDLCNSSTKLSALFAVVPFALMKILAF